MYERILVALDGSPLAERVLPHVEALARVFGSRIIFLRATTPPERLVAALTAPDALAPPIDPTPLIEEERADARGYLSRLVASLSAEGLNCDFEYPEGDAGEMIVERARDLGVDLIAMTTHGRGGFGRLIFGSVAEEVLQKAACPILLVRVHEE